MLPLTATIHHSSIILAVPFSPHFSGRTDETHCAADSRGEDTRQLNGGCIESWTNAQPMLRCQEHIG